MHVKSNKGIISILRSRPSHEEQVRLKSVKNGLNKAFLKGRKS